MKNAPIRAVIADDEALARKFIRRMLKDDPDVEIVGECGNGKEAVEMIRKTESGPCFPRCTNAGDGRVRRP
jgi:CheY-like chemotaxis protein